MAHIIKLTKDVADKIAAGEVVERPLSVVKELLENSLDAGATSVVIEIEGGGKKSVRVTDNGSGIAAEDLSLVFERHATSKIRDAKDLEAIGTLGFRGEALSSIAAVSRVELITKTAEAKTASRVLAEAGTITSIEEVGAPDGTTILVRDLFYNTPARLKFLKPDGTEASLVIDLVQRMALSYPTVKMGLVSNGKSLVATNVKGDVYTKSLRMYCRDVAEHLLRVEAERDGLRLSAFISAPEYTKATRRNQYFFVNGRAIGSKLLETAVADGYREKMFEGRYPVCFLFLAVDPGTLDVNIHPAKREVKFEEEGKVRAFVADAVRNALFTRYAVPEMHYSDGKRTEVVAGRVVDAVESGENGGSANVVATPDANRRAETLLDELADVKENVQNKPDKAKGRFAGISKIDRGEQTSVDVKEFLSTRKNEPVYKPVWADKPQGIANTAVSTVEPGSGATKIVDNSKIVDNPEATKPAEPPKKPFEPNALHITGSVFATYITASDDEFFYLIDQHAAHERVFYEQFVREWKNEEKASQILLQPFVFEVSPAIKARELDWMPVLADMAYAVEEFGPKSYAVKEIPAFMDDGEARRFLDEFIERLEEERDVTDREKLDRIITMSCKSAVKANDALDPAEMKRLLDDLSNCENPFTCPHGRPVFLKLSKSEIERLFKRK